MDYETIDINDERARELAQILVNEKAIAILHLIDDRALSISEISRELELPMSTVSYHIDKMMRVGLVEIAGKKYGKRLQEVKLYRASNRPILLVPRKSVASVQAKTTLRFERLHVISLSIAGVASAVAYLVAGRVLGGGAGTQKNGAIPYGAGGNVTTLGTHPKSLGPSMPNGSVSGGSTSSSSNLLSGGGSTAHVQLAIAVMTFVITLFVIYYLLKRQR